jgi:hypothetical protein
MLKKLFITAAAAAAVSVPLAGAAWAAPSDPSGNGIGQGGVPDKAAAFTRSVFPNTDLSDLESGKSGNIAPGTAFSTGAKVPGVNAPEGYGSALTQFYRENGYPNTPDFGPLTPGQVTKVFTSGCGNGAKEPPAGCVP